MTKLMAWWWCRFVVVEKVVVSTCTAFQPTQINSQVVVVVYSVVVEGMGVSLHTSSFG